MLSRLAWLAVAGALGTLVRYVLATLVQRVAGPHFAWGTLAVNLLGCLLFGALVALSDQRALIGQETRLVLLTGFLGALTTFSTFAFETQQMLAQGQWLLASVNLVAQNALGLGAIALGGALGRTIA